MRDEVLHGAPWVTPVCAVMRYMSTCMCDMRFMKYMRYRVLRDSHRAAMMV